MLAHKLLRLGLLSAALLVRPLFFVSLFTEPEHRNLASKPLQRVAGRIVNREMRTVVKPERVVPTTKALFSF
jgi:hypothetical protein